MCNFLSAIVSRTGEIYYHPLSDSHTHLIAHFGLKEGKAGQNFICVEFTPEGGKIDQPDGYTLSVDETRIPSWFDDEAREKVVGFLRGTVERMIVRDDREILLGGCWIVAGKATVDLATNCRIISVRDSATINYVGGSATINYVGDSATINYVGGSATIKDVGDSATINYVGGSATINYVGDSATINYVGGSATIKDVGDSATIVNDRRPAKPVTA
jgi:hypothetical protein